MERPCIASIFSEDVTHTDAAVPSRQAAVNTRPTPGGWCRGAVCAVGASSECGLCRTRPVLSSSHDHHVSSVAQRLIRQIHPVHCTALALWLHRLTRWHAGADLSDRQKERPHPDGRLRQRRHERRTVRRRVRACVCSQRTRPASDGSRGARTGDQPVHRRRLPTHRITPAPSAGR